MQPDPSQSSACGWMYQRMKGLKESVLAVEHMTRCASLCVMSCRTRGTDPRLSSVDC